jgi:hypothetical protein
VWSTRDVPWIFLLILDLWGAEYTRWTLDFPLNPLSIVLDLWDVEFSGCTLDFPHNPWTIVLDQWIVEYAGRTLDFPLNHWSMDLKSLRFSFFIVVYDSEYLTLLTKPYLKGFTTSDSLFSFYFDAGKQIFNAILNLHRIIKNSFVIFF